MDYGGFLREVAQGRIPAVALLHGAEARLLEDALAQVTRALFPDPSLLWLGREVFDAGETTAETIVRAALTLPGMAGVRLVAVKRAQALPAKQAGALVDYLRDPSPHARLLLMADEPLPPGHWLLRAVPAAVVIDVPRLAGRALVSWLQERAKAEGYELTPAAAQLLIRWTGEDLTTLAGELEKARLFCGPGQGVIGEDPVRQIVGEHRVGKSFELADAVSRGQTELALPLLEQLLAAGEEPLAILGTLARLVKTTWQVGEWRRQGKSSEEIGRLLRRPAFAVDALAARTGVMSSDRLARALDHCWEVERRLKRGGRPRPELTLLVADLCRAG